MQLSWLEDFLVLLEERNFSIAAERRFVSQPAFSRRIQSLEEWLGVALVDRGKKPVRFMPGTDAVEADIRALTQQIYALRSRLRSERGNKRTVTVGTQQALSVSVFPRLSKLVKERSPDVSFRLRSANWEDCIAMFLRRDVDLLLCYETEQHPVKLPSALASKIPLGVEDLIPVGISSLSEIVKATGDPPVSIPLLSYPSESFLGRVIMEVTLNRIMQASDVDIICESAFSAGLREMALHGMGIAWLPRLLVVNDLDSGRLSDFSSELGAIPVLVSLFQSSAHPNENAHFVSSLIRERVEAYPGLLNLPDA